MDILTYTDARKQLKAVMDRAIHDREETVVTRSGQEAVVIVGKAEWDAIQTTLHLLTSPANAARLRAAITELEAGQGCAVDAADLL
ncbi:type II toxin-antitoxin system Phd/YefM family antitoxin [Frigidibacter sp. MR17.24]|uniref:type II toxin-antitoxin system Phd/YefM family antitoxin n=1 Tax=Frigidibacter sp. MR17.24 TaxID=3127345 RepID=UPI003012A5D4